MRLGKWYYCLKASYRRHHQCCRNITRQKVYNLWLISYNSTLHHWDRYGSTRFTVSGIKLEAFRRTARFSKLCLIFTRWEIHCLWLRWPYNSNLPQQFSRSNIPRLRSQTSRLHSSITIPLDLLWQAWLIQMKVGCSTLPVNFCFGFVLNCIGDCIFQAFFISLAWIVSKLNSASSYMGLSGWDARRKGAKPALIPWFSYCYIHPSSFDIHNRCVHLLCHFIQFVGVKSYDGHGGWRIRHLRHC